MVPNALASCCCSASALYPYGEALSGYVAIAALSFLSLTPVVSPQQLCVDVLVRLVVIPCWNFDKKYIDGLSQTLAGSRRSSHMNIGPRCAQQLVMATLRSVAKLSEIIATVHKVKNEHDLRDSVGASVITDALRETQKGLWGDCWRKPAPVRNGCCECSARDLSCVTVDTRADVSRTV